MKNLSLLLFAMGIAPVLCAPALAQPDTNGARFTPLVNDLPYPLVTPEEAIKRIAGKPIVLKLRDVTLVEALQELQRQSGAKIDTGWNANSAEMKKKLSLDLETTSFNRALYEILDEAGVKARLRPLGVGLWGVEVGSSDGNQNARQSGLDPLSIRLIKVNNTLSKTVDLSEPDKPQNSDDNALTLFFDTPPDPLLELATPRLRITRAEDERGRVLTLDKVEGRQRSLVLGLNYYSRQPLTIRLSQPAADARKLAHLEGVAVYVVPSARANSGKCLMRSMPKTSSTNLSAMTKHFARFYKASHSRATA